MDADLAGLVPVAYEPLLAALSGATADVLLSSPFVSAPAAGHLRKIAKASPASWRLLTALVPESVATGALNLEALRWLRKSGVEIRSLSNLHAKAALCDDTFGLVGSANLTGRGLGLTGTNNAELGVLLDRHQRSAARQLLSAWWSEASTVDDAALQEAELKARALPRPGAPEVSHQERRVEETAEALLLEARDRGLRVKAVYGEGADLFDGDGWIFSSPGRPSFAVGDLVLIYAGSAAACNAVVEIQSEARHDPEFVASEGGYTRAEANRWPWVNRVRGRLVIPAERAATPADIGFVAQGLQNGRKRLDLSQFAVAMRLAASHTPEG